MLADILIGALGLMFMMAFIMAIFMVCIWVLQIIWFFIAMLYYCVRGEFPGDTILRKLHGQTHSPSRSERQRQKHDRP